MSKEHHQMRIRLPLELKEKIDEAAKSHNRTMNAEIVHRLEASFMREQMTDDLVPAQEALALSELSRKSLPAQLMAKVAAAINQAIMFGHKRTSIDLDEFQIELLEEQDFEAISSQISQKLDALGYVSEWSGDILHVDFSPEFTK